MEIASLLNVLMKKGRFICKGGDYPEKTIFKDSHHTLYSPATSEELEQAVSLQHRDLLSISNGLVLFDTTEIGDPPDENGFIFFPSRFIREESKILHATIQESIDNDLELWEELKAASSINLSEWYKGFIAIGAPARSGDILVMDTFCRKQDEEPRVILLDHELYYACAFSEDDLDDYQWPSLSDFLTWFKANPVRVLGGSWRACPDGPLAAYYPAGFEYL